MPTGLQSIQAQSRTAITMSKTLTQNYTRQLSAPEQEFIKAELAKAAASEAQKG